MIALILLCLIIGLFGLLTAAVLGWQFILAMAAIAMAWKVIKRVVFKK